MTSKIIVLLIFSISLTANAQEILTLKQCIDYGLKNNHNNIIYANEKLAADAKAKEALADYLPKISLTSTLDNNLRLKFGYRDHLPPDPKALFHFSPGDSGINNSGGRFIKSANKDLPMRPEMITETICILRLNN